MPIPLEVFRPIIKVFEHDEWWSGMSAETQEHWNAQFAGMFSISHPVEAIDITRGSLGRASREVRAYEWNCR